jgi:hypothetical protein
MSSRLGRHVILNVSCLLLVPRVVCSRAFLTQKMHYSHTIRTVVQLFKYPLLSWEAQSAANWQYRDRRQAVLKDAPQVGCVGFGWERDVRLIYLCV